MQYIVRVCQLTDLSKHKRNFYTLFVDLSLALTISEHTVTVGELLRSQWLQDLWEAVYTVRQPYSFFVACSSPVWDPSPNDTKPNCKAFDKMWGRGCGSM